MNRLYLLTGIAALGLAACQPEVRKTETTDMPDDQLRVISKLDCPQREGQLELVSAAADGQSCAYKTSAAEVTLRLAALTGDAKALLDPIEAELKSIVPAPVRPAAGAGATASTEPRGKQTEIKFPGLHIKADEDGGADIRVGSIHIDADDQGGAEVKVGGETTINADNGGAEIRTGTTTGDVRATYILANEKAPNGFHVVGYEARGPQSGPIVIATLKARDEGHRQNDLFDDLKDLVERQVGD